MTAEELDELWKTADALATLSNKHSARISYLAIDAYTAQKTWASDAAERMATLWKACEDYEKAYNAYGIAASAYLTEYKLWLAQR